MNDIEQAESISKPDNMSTSTTKKVVGLLVLMLLGGLFGATIAQAGAGSFKQHLAGRPWAAVAFLVWIPIAYVVSVTWHELGHVIGGLLVRFQFCSLVVGPLKLDRRGGSLRVGLNTSVNLGGGLALMLPMDQKNLRRRFTVFAAAGPVSSLLLAAVAFACSHMLFTDSMPEIYFDVLGWLSLLVFFVTALPLKTGGFLTDGARVLALRNERESKATIALLVAISNVQAGVRPRELPLQTIEEGIENARGGVDLVSLLCYRYYHACDSEDLTAARVALDRIMENVDCFPEGIRESLWSMPTLHAAIYEQDLEEARVYFANYKPSAFTDQAEGHQLQAAMSILEGDPQLALDEIELALPLLDELLEPGLAPFHRDCLLELRKRALEQQHA